MLQIRDGEVTPWSRVRGAHKVLPAVEEFVTGHSDPDRPLHVAYGHSRRPEALRRFLQEARAEVGKVGPKAVAEGAEAARKRWVDAQLVDRGRLRAESLGWTDVYTLTKALAERVAEELWPWVDAGPSTPLGEAEAAWLRDHPR